MAIYPSRIPGFVSHRNLLDDVDATHINYIQDELTAIAQVLGPMPHVYNDVSGAEGVVYPETGENGAIEDTDFSTTATVSTIGVRPRDHASVAQRLDYIERGQQNHCVKLQASNFDIPRSSSVSITDRPRGIKFPPPPTKRDPFRMYNQIGLTLRKSGFWTFTGNILVTPQGTSAENTGLYQAAIEIDGGFLEGMDRHNHSDNKNSFGLNVNRSAFLTAGTRVSLRMSHNALVTQRIRFASLSAFLVREDL